MTDHIGEATAKVDLDALEKLADEVLESQKGTDLQRMADADQAFYMLSDPATIKALIVELKEGREAVEELLYAHTDKSIAMGEAFLARNGKGEG